MSNVLRIAIVDPDDASRGMLKAMILGIETIWLEAECSRYEFFADVAEQTTPDLGIVSIDSDPRKALELVSEMSNSHSNCAIFVLSSSNDGNLILQAMRAGAKEFLSLPLQLEDLLNALGRMRDRRFGADPTKRKSGSEVVAVVGVDGGIGSTTLSVNLGCQWAGTASHTVSLIDLDFYLGDVDILLDIIPDYTVVDVAQNVSRLDFSLLKRSLTKHTSGLYLLPRPMDLDDVATITAESIKRVIGLLKATFTHLVLDLSKSFTAIDIAAMEVANTILLVTQLDLSSLRNTVRLMSWLENKEGLGDKIKIVVNRIGNNSNQITMKKAQETIGQEIFWQLPNDFKAAEDSKSAGLPLQEQAPRSGLTLAIAALSDALIGKEADNEKADSGGKMNFGRLFNNLLSGKGKQ